MNTSYIVEKIKDHKNKILFVIGTITLISIYNMIKKQNQSK